MSQECLTYFSNGHYTKVEKVQSKHEIKDPNQCDVLNICNKNWHYYSYVYLILSKQINNNKKCYIAWPCTLFL